MRVSTRMPQRGYGSMKQEGAIGAGGIASWNGLQSWVNRTFVHPEDLTYDPERGQALSRLFSGPVVAIYMVLAVLLAPEQPWALTELIAVIIPLYLISSWLLFMRVVQRPGRSIPRRAFAMALDYAAMAYTLGMTGPQSLPVYAFVLWVTVGNGIRYGPRTLLVATICAFATLATAWAFNAYWREQPFLVLTLFLTCALVPAYVFVLLNRIQRARDVALEANVAKSRFLAQASHDLRQPIHAISLFIACLRDAGLGPEERKMVEHIDHSLQSLMRLFRSLLDISTLDSGKVKPNGRKVAVGALLDELKQRNAQAAEWANVTIRLVSCRSYVRVDDVLLSTILQNVITNSLKYAPDGNILIGCRRRDGKLAIEIYDTGPGIPEAHLARVFDEFYQVRERGDRDIEGVGLGLTIVSRLVKLLGLSVELRSAEGRGTCVRIGGLEIVEAPRPEEIGATPAYPAPGAVSGVRILLVDDDREVLDATAAMLRRWGCIVQAEIAPPPIPADCDMVITDFDLGDRQTGADCIAMVRESIRRRVPALVMTGHDEARVRAELDDATIPVLTKPVRPAELRSVLNTLALANAAQKTDQNSKM